MTHLQDHPAGLGRVGYRHGVTNPPQPEALRDDALASVETDGTSDERHLERLLLICHGRGLTHRRLAVAAAISARSRPRSRATSTGALRSDKPVNVARTTLCGLADPSDFVMMFVTPAASTTARTAAPAMIPVPSGAGFSRTLPAPNFPMMGCGTVVPCSGTRIRPFFAASMPFLIAEGTSFALPTPKPTTPCPSPTTTSALKLRFLPPLTTLVTRLMLTTVSFRASCEASIFSRVSIISFRSRIPAPLLAPLWRWHGCGRDRETRRGRRRRA